MSEKVLLENRFRNRTPKYHGDRRVRMQEAILTAHFLSDNYHLDTFGCLGLRFIAQASTRVSMAFSSTLVSNSLPLGGSRSMKRSASNATISFIRVISFWSSISRQNTEHTPSTEAHMLLRQFYTHLLRSRNVSTSSEPVKWVSQAQCTPFLVFFIISSLLIIALIRSH